MSINFQTPPPPVAPRDPIRTASKRWARYSIFMKERKKPFEKKSNRFNIAVNFEYFIINRQKSINHRELSTSDGRGPGATVINTVPFYVG